MQATENPAAAGRRTTIWPRYDAATTGFRNYWYPVAWSKAVHSKPLSVEILDERIVLLRENGRVYALFDQCPHRGVPLSVGRREFPGTWTCRYHGWTYDVETGVLKAALTDGPDSPICGKVRVKTYPVEERLGLVWVYMGVGPPPPVEADIPCELFDPDMVILGRMTLQEGNWRYGCENAFDEGHAKYLHRYGAVQSLTMRMPAWSTIKVIPEDDGWITRDTQTLSFQDSYPELGRWPARHFWQWRSARSRLSMRLPCIMRNQHLGLNQWQFAWYVPVGKAHNRYLQFYCKKVSSRAAKVWAHAFYWTYYRWAHLVQFNNQDAWMVALMPETPPERLYRPDVSITAWRKLCEHPRGEEPPTLSLGEELARLEEEPPKQTARPGETVPITAS